MTETKRRLLWRWTRELIFILIVVAVVGTLMDVYRLHQRDDKLSEPVVNFLYDQLDDGKAQRSEKPLLIYVWASWCGVCKLTSQAVSNMADDHQVVTVALKSGDQSQVNAFMKDKGLNFKAYADSDGRLSEQLGVSATPTFLIIQPDGTQSFYSVGVNTEPTLRLKMRLLDQSNT